MIPGETIKGLDFQDHLWVVLSIATGDGMVAIANFRTHGRSPTCGYECVLMLPGEHPFVVRETCLYLRKAVLNPVVPLDAARDRGQLRMHDPLSEALLERLQREAVASRQTGRLVKLAIEATIIR